MTSGARAGPRWTANVHRQRLPNGLTVLVQPDRAAPAVAVVTHVKAGFFDEPDRWIGISHILEHMFFKGTPTRGVGRIASETKALGGYLNASTSYDATSYFVVLPAANFRQALEIQADALQNASIDPDELARELKVIIEEAKRKLDTPSAVAHETLNALLFDRHRIRRWRIGTEEQLAGYRRDDVVGYYQSRYVPERVIVSVVGNVDPEQVMASVERLYGGWPARPGAVDPSPDEPWRRETRTRNLRGDVRQAELALGWRGVAPLDPDAAPLDLAAMVLSAGRGGWLYQRVRQTGLATSVGAYHYSPSEVGVFSISVDLDPNHLAAALTAVAGETARLRTMGPSTGAVERVKTLLKVQWSRRLESVEGRATALAGVEALGSYELMEDEYNRLMSATPERIRAVAERYLEPNAVGAVGYFPNDATSEVTLDLLQRAFSQPISANGHASVASPPLVPEPTSARVRGRAQADVLHVPLAGVDLLIRSKPGVPLVTIGGYRRRSLIEERAQAGLAALAVRAAARGAGQWDASGLADALEQLGGTLGTNVGLDWWGYSTSVDSRHLARAGAVLAEVLNRPRFEPAEVIRERDTLTEEAIQAADDMFRYPIQLAVMTAFGERGYGLPIKGLPDALTRLTVEQVSQWHRAEVAGSRLVVIAVGELDPEGAADQLSAVFGGDPSVAAVADLAELRINPKPGWAEESRAKSQTGIAMLFPGPGRADSERHVAEVLGAIASGLGGRLFYALRDRRSLAYTVLMSSWQRAAAGGILTYIATSPARETEAREAMLEEAARFGTELVSEEELERAVNYLTGQIEVQRQTGAAVASEILDAWLVGRGLDELLDPIAPYRAVTRAQIRDLAARSLRAESRAEGVVRGVKV